MSCGWAILESWNVALLVLTAATSPGGARPLCQASEASLGGWRGLPQPPTHLGYGRHAAGEDRSMWHRVLLSGFPPPTPLNKNVLLGQGPEHAFDSGAGSRCPRTPSPQTCGNIEDP